MTCSCGTFPVFLCAKKKEQKAPESGAVRPAIPVSKPICGRGGSRPSNYKSVAHIPGEGYKSTPHYKHKGEELR